MNFAYRLIQYDFSSIDELIDEFNKLTKKEVIDLLDVTIKTVSTPIITVKEGNDIKYQYAHFDDIYEVPEYLKPHIHTIKSIGFEFSNVLHSENLNTGDQLTLKDTNHDPLAPMPNIDIHHSVTVNLLSLFTNTRTNSHYRIYFKRTNLKNIKYKQIIFGLRFTLNVVPTGLCLRNNNRLNYLLSSLFRPIPDIVKIIQKTYDCKVVNDHLIFSNTDLNRSYSHVIDFKEIQHSRSYNLAHFNRIFLNEIDLNYYKSNNETFASMMNSIKAFVKAIEYQDKTIDSDILPWLNMTNDLPSGVLLRQQSYISSDLLIVKNIKFMLNGVLIRTHEFSLEQMITEYQALLPIIHEIIYKYPAEDLKEHDNRQLSHNLDEDNRQLSHNLDEDNISFNIEFYDLPIKLYADFIILKYGIEHGFIKYQKEKNKITYCLGNQSDTVEF